MGKRRKRKGCRAFTDPEGYRAAVYSQRNCILKKLGYSSYQIYLKSDLWSDIRAKQLEKEPNCMSCGKKATQVHHTVYTHKVLDGRNDQGLHSVCGKCHFKSEFREGDREKLNPKQATVKLKIMGKRQ